MTSWLVFANALLPFLVALLALAAAAPAEAGALELLWEIGKADNNTAEFALAPNGYARFEADPVFIVGASDPKTDWPYVHPGPADTWAGSRQHTFAVIFALRDPVPKAECRLRCDLADTHSSAPPNLKITVNQREFTHATPRGGGTGDSIRGDIAASKAHCFDIVIPADTLKPGRNEIAITTLSGSWILYDWIGFEAPAETQLATLEGFTAVHTVDAPQLLVEKGGALHQVVRVKVRHVGEPTEALVSVAGGEPVKQALAPGEQTLELLAPRVQHETTADVRLEVGGKEVAARQAVLKPVREWELYLLPHSHVDIGYTHVQSEVEAIQCGYLEQCVELGRKTADYPPGARFKWNSEVLWAVDCYLRKAPPDERKDFVAAVEKGWIGLDALYGNELTALCRPEELCELLGYARRLAEQYDLPIDAAMISDVPGYTWGLIPVLAQSGVKYFSIGPNGGHRIGRTLSAWADRPFYWVSPSGREKVLCWVAGRGYAWFHRGPLASGSRILGYLNMLEDAGYPYDILYGRYNIGGDNGPPDTNLPDFVKDWNERYAYPKLIIATTREMFHAFEQRYADAIPSIRGDFTPYWEDGAASSARETNINREAAERLVQAQTLFAMLDPDRYNPSAFHEAWRNIILYDEHTWGAHNSISEPECDFVKQQWARKQAFALDGDKRSRALLNEALEGFDAPTGSLDAVLVFNTSAWPRTDLVVVDGPAGERVEDARGRPVPSQRLSTGQLAFLASDVPAMGAAKFFFRVGEPLSAGCAKAEGTRLSSECLTVGIDEATGAINSLACGLTASDLVDTSKGPGLNDYLYVAGRDPKDPQRNGPVKIAIKESGPLVASLLVECGAPGCKALTREIRVIDGMGRVEIINTLDKENVYAQEAVHFAFPFNVPEGVMHMDIPWAVCRPEADQLPGACKNYFTVQRWVDIANQDFGVTWATVDAPLIEVGRITCDPRAVGWLEHIEPSQTLYSYVMNNYWETNYKASQDGPTTFRYAIRPHARFDPAAAARFGIERSQPLIVVPVAEDAPVPPSFLDVEPAGVIVTALKPSDDGKAWIVRLFGASGRPEKAALTWRKHKQPKTWLSDLTEHPGPEVKGTIDVPAYGMVTVRVD